MSKIISKSGLAIALSKLEGFKSPKVREEQYITDSEVAASVLWQAYQLGDIERKIIADLGCGTGVLGIGALLLGAKKVFLIDLDEKALETAKINLSKVRSETSSLRIGKMEVEFIFGNVKDLKIKADVVIENPPFGTKVKHSDIIFLKKALETAPIVYSFHKSESKAFLEAFSAKKGTRITHIWGFKFPLKATFLFHRRQIHRIDVSCFRFEKIK